MPSQDITITNEYGIHARPAAQIVKTANQFTADITIEKDGEEVDGKSIMGLMMLAAGHGSTLTITTEGEQADEALAAVIKLIESNFDEK